MFFRTTESLFMCVVFFSLTLGCPNLVKVQVFYLPWSSSRWLLWTPGMVQNPSQCGNVVNTYPMVNLSTKMGFDCFPKSYIRGLANAKKVLFYSFMQCIVHPLPWTSKDVLHPCTYLWVGRTKMTPEKAAQLTWSQALVTRGWWEIMIGRLILNQTVTGRMMVKGSWALPLQLPTILMTLLLKLRIWHQPWCI